MNNTNLPGATNATLSFASAQPAHAGGCQIVITNLAGATPSAGAILTVSITDSDGDGMPGVWETAHNLNPNLNDAALDADDDGVSNLG